jgi:hypothetical protein
MLFVKSSITLNCPTEQICIIRMLFLLKFVFRYIGMAVFEPFFDTGTHSKQSKAIISWMFGSVKYSSLMHFIEFMEHSHVHLYILVCRKWTTKPLHRRPNCVYLCECGRWLKSPMHRPVRPWIFSPLQYACVAPVHSSRPPLNWPSVQCTP